MVALTIGMSTFNDFDGVYFTLQALRMYQDLDDTEILVVDNFGCDATREFVEGWTKARYILAPDHVGTSAPRDLLFREGVGEAVLCIDSHVLLVPGAIARLKGYYRAHPGSADLLQGPLLYDDLVSISTHFEPVWRDHMWGVWATDPRGAEPEADPFEIPMQGLGLFSSRKGAWQGFNPAFGGFGGEEGYIHEKFRQAGGRCLCLPWLRWMHRFGRPSGVPYPLAVEDRIRNYAIGHRELGLDLAPMIEHFSSRLPADTVDQIVRDALDHVIHETGDNRLLRALTPLVSCICLTYNRAPDYLHLVEEAIESFLRQDYPNKELVIVNDCPGQELVCDAPGVRILNVPHRFRTLGEKHNFGVRSSRGELIAEWDDDDIHLPWRISESVTRLGTAAYFNPRAYWYLDGAGLHDDHSMGVSHNAAIMTRAAFDAVGGYPEISNGPDQVMDRALLERMARVVDPNQGDPPLTKSGWFYIYRWGVSPVHVSSRSGDDGLYLEIGAMPVRPGRHILRPHWSRDYVAETRAFLNT